jgi:hypothetical protein
MVSQHPAKVYYPDSDGQPMADNTKQFRWIVTIKENLDLLFAADPNVFVAGDLGIPSKVITRFAMRQMRW